ncbi:kinesin light chain 1, partial [Rasamsonia emersonii CBS 393.64]
MDPLSIVGLVGNIVQFLDFTGTILSTSAHIYSSSRGVLPENADIETVTRHLVLLNNKLKDAASSSGAGELQKLCALCSNVADELLAALDKLKVKGQPGRWKSVKKALQSIWSKNKIEELEQRLARLREELNLHVVVELRDQLALFRAENSDRLRELDIATKHVVDAIVDQRDVFEAAHDAQLTCMKDLHRETLARVKEEHLITRREILHEIRAGLRSESADRQTRRQEACWSVPFVRNPKFVGREQQLDELERRLFVEGSCTKIAIFGLGGVGKTQIALELAYRTRAQRPDCSVFWVPSTTVESFQQAYLDIGRKLCLPQAEKQNDNIKKIVQEYLSQDSAGRWLLIYDNADDLDLWFKNTDGTNEPALINYVPTSSQGSIIFTTRDRKAAVKFAAQNLVGVGEMDEQIATQMLSKSLIDQRLLNDHRTTLDLLEQLTFLPLAIAQAAAYINENGISLSEYLSLLKDKEHRIIEILSEDFEDDGRYRNIKNPIASTWLISFEQIRRRDPLAAEYLSFMACIDPRAVPQSLLPPAKSKKRMIEAIGTLSAYSFITKRPADSSLDLHRLVHLATRNWLQMENSLSKWVAKAIVRLDEVFPSNDHTNRDLWRAYLPHALYVVRSDLGDEVPEKLSLLEKLGLCLLSDGRYNDAEMSFVHVTETRKRVLGEEDLSTLVSMANLALTYCNQGRWTEAEELNKEVLEISKRVRGERSTRRHCPSWPI